MAVDVSCPLGSQGGTAERVTGTVQKQVLPRPTVLSTHTDPWWGLNNLFDECQTQPGTPKGIEQGLCQFSAWRNAAFLERRNVSRRRFLLLTLHR